MEPVAVILKQARNAYHPYADDTLLYIKISSAKDTQPLNSTLPTVQSWLTNNHLKFNPNQPELLFIQPKEKSFPVDIWFDNLTAPNCKLSISNSVKSLGLTLDRNLNMKKHINALAKSAFCMLKHLKKNQTFHPPR